MPLIATRGAASVQGFGEFAQSAAPNYIEDVFSTYLFTGNGTTQTVTNGIDLIGKGGMVWRKQRDATANHFLADTVRGTYSTLSSNTTAAASGASYIDFLSDGFQAVNSNSSNPSGALQASWTFREQPKFFDVVTYTGNGVSGRLISHNLGSTPGFVVVKNITNANSWYCWHRSLPNSGGFLETTDAFSPGLKYICGTVNDTVFSVDSAGASVNGTGNTYVAYLFAHNAGGFGLTGTDNVISCGYAAGGTTVNLGYEPQWVLTKNPNSASNWLIVDNMRGMPADGGGPAKGLLPNSSAAESDWGGYVQPTATGFYNGVDAIYIAIRRGPMKVPTSGTSVFDPNLGTGSGAPRFVSDFPTDLFVKTYRYGYLGSLFGSRLTGDQYMSSAATSAEASDSTFFKFDYQNGTSTSGDSNDVGWSFKRAPGFFDEVCYTGTGSATTFTHNLTVVPELMIVKSRTVANSWLVYISALGPTKTLTLNAVSKEATSATAWNNTAPTASVFTLGSAAAINTAASTNVAYLFATLAGVSKVGNYTGTGATQTINCGFTGGARFVLIKRTDNPGAWYVWDTARGMVSGTDPSLRLNSTAAEVNANSVYTITTGFQIVTTVDDINTAGGEYIFFAIS